MRSSLYLVSLGRIHHFYLRHDADSKRTSSRRKELLADFTAVPFFRLAKGESQTMDLRVSVVTFGVKDLGVRRDSTSTASVGSRYMRTTRSSSSEQAGWFLRCFYVIISRQIFRPIRQHSDMHPWHWHTTSVRKMN